MRTAVCAWSGACSRGVIGVVLVGAFSAARAAVTPAPHVPRVTLPLMNTPPTVDGRIDETEWAGAVRNVGFVGHGSDTLMLRDGVFWLGSDGHSLFLAVQTETPPTGEILTRAVPHDKLDVTAAFHDDCLELVLDPKRGRTAGERSYYHIITNARGALFDRSIDPDDKQNPMRTAWRLTGWTFASAVKDGWWHVEMKIPFESLGVTPADLSHAWGLRVARNWRRPARQSQWVTKSGSYLDQPTMPVIRWDPAAPVVQVRSIQRDWQEARAAVSIFNPHAEPVSVSVRLSDAWHFNPPKELERDVTVAPGQTELLELAAPDGGDAGLHRTIIHVASPDGQTIYYHRDYRWSLHRPAELWSIAEEEKKAVSLLFKYYPYHSKVRFQVDVQGLAAKDRVSAIAASIRRLQGEGAAAGAALWEQSVPVKDFVAEGIFGIPDLPDGRYGFSALLKGGSGLPAEPVSETFVRERFEWEHNKLGVSDEVMPPFTPLQVSGNEVRSVLREHQHGAAGLWDQVTSQGRRLLTAPMSWRLALRSPAGEPVAPEVTGQGWQCLAQSDTSVRGEARWSAGALDAHVRTDHDYDGMMLVTLTLEPTGDAVVERLSIEIPVNAAEARYMHAVGDGLRHNYAGFVPPGEGVVWDSSKANKIEIANAFFPYLWIGGGERGICWFADTDRDMLLDEEIPTLALVRDGETLRLRAHLITRPAPLRRRRQIVFGLQATPTKPMPEGWRRWTGRSKGKGGRAVSWVGSTPYWGGIAHDLFPYGKTFEYWEELRKTRETAVVSKEFETKWMGIIDLVFPDNPKKHEFHLRHIRAGFHSARYSPWGGPTRLFGYTNARGIGFHAEEFATFQDEWLRYGWFNRQWNRLGGVSYDVSPSPSFVDFAVWYYKKMIDTWTDGVYWDNTFLSAHYDPVVGNAWFDEKGVVHPGMGLFHLRELIKRTAIMHWQAGRDVAEARTPFISLSHMTNTMIVPVLSFGNCNMDWEWKYGYADFQDRFSPDLTVTETIGRQVGAWGTILAGGHPDVKDPRTPWMWRTRLGVCLVHEIHNFDYRPAEDVAFYEKLFEFGYGLPECKVYNYWDPPHPVSVSGVDARTLVAAKPGGAIVIVTDYGEGGTGEATVDLGALGLSAEVNAADVETGETIVRTVPGRFRFELKKHDFRALRVE